MCPSRKNMFSVMSNAHFGGATMKSENGTTVYVPENGICQSRNSGIIKKAWQKRIARLTLEDCAWLFARGCTISKA